MTRTTLSADQRSREVWPAPEAEQAAREARGELARVEVKAARALATIESSRCYLRSGFASVFGWAVRAGYGPQQVQRLLALGRSLVAAPELEAKVRCGDVAAESAISVGRVLAEPALDLAAPEKAAEREAWVENAESVPPLPLRDAADRAIEEARGGQPTLPLRFLVTKDAKDGFFRVRLLMSKGQPRMLTEGQTFSRLVESWIGLNDPRLRSLPQRRRGPTGEGERIRYVPRRVQATVARRSGGVCEVCRARRAREKIHLRVPHAEGGSREADNIADACRDCHLMVDAGLFVFSHFDEEGHPRWRCDSERFGAAQRRDHPPGDDGGELVRERAPPYGRAPRGSSMASRRPGRRGCRPKPGQPPETGGMTSIVAPFGTGVSSVTKVSSRA